MNTLNGIKIMVLILYMQVSFVYMNMFLYLLNGGQLISLIAGYVCAFCAFYVVTIILPLLGDLRREKRLYAV